MSADDIDTSLPTASQNFSNHINGPIAFGWICAVALYGYLVATFFKHLASKRYSRDRIGLKLLAWAVFAMASIQTGFYVYELYHSATLQNRSIDDLYAEHPIDAILPLLAGFIAAAVQTYFASRIIRLRENFYYRLCVGLFAGSTILMSLLGSVIVVYVGFMAYAKPLDIPAISFNIGGGLWLWNAMVVDIFISIAMYFSLREHLDQKLSAKMQTMIRAALRLSFREVFWLVLKIIQRFAEVTLCLSMVQSAAAITSVAFDPYGLLTNKYNLRRAGPLSNLYAIALYTTMASRDSIRDMATKSGSRQLSIPEGLSLNSYPPATSTNPRALDVYVETYTLQEPISEKHRSIRKDFDSDFQQTAAV